VQHHDAHNPGSARAGEVSGESVTARALSVLAAFENSAGPLSVGRIASRSGLPRSTAYRLVHELEGWGGLDKTVDGKYQVGMRIWELGQLAGRRLRDHAHPFLQDLFDLTRENVHLAVREGTQTLYVDKIYGSRKLPMISRVGGRLPLHTTAVGRVLLAAQPPWFITAYLERELEAPTSKTVTDPAELRRAIDEVVHSGVSVTVEQMRVGACSIAIPVVVDGSAIAAVGMVLEASKSSERHRLIPLLRGTVDRIEAAMATRRGGPGVSRGVR
jgi:DNA-binding IclR family transcriptional regulator